MKYKNIHIIGTSHISKESIDEITAYVEQNNPDIIAIELDKKRYYSLTSKATKLRFSDIRKIGLKGYLFALIGGYLQKKVGNSVGVAPGSDMLSAIKLAKKHKSKLALIDQDIQVTLSRFSQTLTFKEKLNIFVDIIKSILFRKQELKELGIENLDLSKVPSKLIISKLIKRLRQRYPNIYKVLIEERNQLMVHNLKLLAQNYPDKKILAVVGAGHLEGMEKLLKTLDITYHDTTFNQQPLYTPLSRLKV